MAIANGLQLLMILPQNTPYNNNCCIQNQETQSSMGDLCLGSSMQEYCACHCFPQLAMLQAFAGLLLLNSVSATMVALYQMNCIWLQSATTPCI
jgi:hypothetical protein